MQNAESHSVSYHRAMHKLVMGISVWSNVQHNEARDIFSINFADMRNILKALPQSPCTILGTH